MVNPLRPSLLFIRFVGILLIGSAAAPATTVAAAGDRPNILFIMSDDHAVQAIGAYGGRLAPLDVTPNLDRLAREGMLFDRAFCGNSICSPSRASILTGQHSQANGVLVLGQPLPPERQDLPRLMREAGYVTALLGKWHLQTEPAAFDYYKILPGQGRYFDPTFHEMGRGEFPDNEVQESGHSTDVITQMTFDWLEGRDRTKPFFLALQYKAPHDDFLSAPRYEEYLADVTIPYPEEDPFAPNQHGSIATRGHRDELMPYLASSVSRRNVLRSQLERMTGVEVDPNLSDRDYWRATYQAYLKAYLRTVKGIDDSIGRIYAHLEREGLLDNTIIVYTSDQGMFLGEHDYMDKRWMYEESMRMPLIVRYPPAVRPGSRSSALVGNIDFAPTLIDYAGGRIPASMHGRSIRPLLEGRTPADWRSALYYRYWMHLRHNCVPAHFGIRSDRYKLIFFYGIEANGGGVRTPPGWEFYDLEKDPREMHNAYAVPAYAGVIADLKRQMLELRDQYDETDEAYPEVQAVIDAHWNTTPASRAEAVRISHQAKAAFELHGVDAIQGRVNRR